MKIETAITQLNKEAEFMGIGLLEVLQDIKQHGKMLYCEKTMAAFVVFMQQGQELFAPVDQ
jgi:hypothetical protein